MADSRTSFDVRSERLNLIASRNANSALSSGADRSDDTTEDVDDWIKSVRALKEKRRAEDEARNKQLEEDILRERKARQERRATRTRSVSPTKSLHEGISGNVSPATSTRNNMLNDSPSLMPKSTWGSPDLTNQRQSVGRSDKPLLGSLRPHDSEDLEKTSEIVKHDPREQLASRPRHDNDIPNLAPKSTGLAKSTSRKEPPSPTSETRRQTNVDTVFSRPAVLSPAVSTHRPTTATPTDSTIRNPSNNTNVNCETLTLSKSPSRLSKDVGKFSLQQEPPSPGHGALLRSSARSSLQNRQVDSSVTEDGSATLSTARQGLRSTNTSRSTISDHVKETLLNAKTGLRSPVPAAKSETIARTFPTRPISFSTHTTEVSGNHVVRQNSVPIPKSAPMILPKSKLPSEALSRHESVPIQHERPKITAVSNKANPSLAALLQRGPRLFEKKTVLPEQTPKQSDGDQVMDTPTEKLQHMTKNRARRPKSKASTQVRGEVAPETVNSSIAVKPTISKQQDSNFHKTPSILSEKAPVTTSSISPKLPAISDITSNGRVRSMPNDQIHLDTRLDPIGSRTRMTSKQGSDTPPASPSRDDFRRDSPRLVLKPGQSGLDQITPRSPFSARSTSPFKSSTSKHLPSKSVSSMTGIADLIRGRADHSARGEPAKSTERLSKSPDHAASTGVSQVWRISQAAHEPKSISEDFNVLYEDEMLLFRFQPSNSWFQWIGRHCTYNGDQQVRRIVTGSDTVTKVFMGEETSEFIKHHKEATIICRRAAQKTDDTELYSVRKYMDGLVVDQVTCSASSLCSGFVYILIRKDLPSTIWIGKGSFPEEITAAKSIMSHFGKSEVFSPLHEGQESSEFWSALGGSARYASSSYWRLRKEFPLYKNELWTVEPTEVVRHQVWSFESLVPEKVHVIDCFFELYIYLSGTNRKEDIKTALNWVKDFSKELVHSRPFLPMALVLCPDSKIPRDLKAIFRGPVQDRADLRILETESAELLLSRSRFRYDEFKSGNVIGHDINKLDQCIDLQDFDIAMGVSKQTFERLSASEQSEIRSRASERLRSI